MSWNSVNDAILAEVTQVPIEDPDRYLRIEPRTEVSSLQVGADLHPRPVDRPSSLAKLAEGTCQLRGPQMKAARDALDK